MAADVDTLQQQIMDMQSQIAFQDDAIRSLDAALAQQQQQVLLLCRQLELLSTRQLEQEVRGREGEPILQDEKPPHY